MILAILIWLCGAVATDAFSGKIPSLSRKDYSHLDKINVAKLEKLFYLKNSRYSPYKNKYTNRPSLNVTELLENVNNELEHQYVKDTQSEIDMNSF